MSVFKIQILKNTFDIKIIFDNPFIKYILSNYHMIPTVNKADDLWSCWSHQNFVLVEETKSNNQNK